MAALTELDVFVLKTPCLRLLNIDAGTLSYANTCPPALWDMTERRDENLAPPRKLCGTITAIL